MGDREVRRTHPCRPPPGETRRRQESEDPHDSDTQGWRGIVLAPPRGDEYHVITVLPHDKASAYATSSEKSPSNRTLGVLELREQGALEDIEPALRQAADVSQARLFDGVNDAVLVRLGIDQDVLPLVRLLTSEDQLRRWQPSCPTSVHRTAGTRHRFDTGTGVARDKWIPRRRRTTRRRRSGRPGHGRRAHV
jgi:hypothetical protein